ncbi:hypothetical protein KC361_g6507 [Hortaea werneckii]|nr:hypothetical protein KC361_g6507 [Hortaea werneckii]
MLIPSKNDDSYAENLIRDEAGQLHRQALSEYQRQQHGIISSSALSESDSQEELLAQIGRQYRFHRPSNASPMERFLTVGATADPFPMYSKKALSDMGINYGSLESLGSRSRAARMVAGEQRCPEVDSPDDMTDSGSVRKAHSSPLEDRGRSKTLPVLQWQRDVAEQTQVARIKRTRTG